jgi:hypothetical protein
MSKLKFRGYLIILTISAITLSFLFFAAPVSASGVGVSPSHLEFGNNSSSFDSILYVINTGERDSLYRLYVDTEYEDWFNISPDELLLAPDQVAEVQVTVSTPWFTSGEHTAYIRVISFEATSDLQVGAGIKVPVYISTGGYLLALIIGISVIALVVLILSTYLVWRRRSRMRRKRLEAQ